MPNKSLGEGTIEINGRVFTLRPSFRALEKVTEQDSIEYLYSMTHDAQTIATTEPHMLSAKKLSVCAFVLFCFSDLTFEETGFTESSKKNPNKLLWRVGKLPPAHVAILAHHCIKWAVIGDPRIKPSKKALAASRSQAFDVSEFVAILVDEFGLSRQDAWDCTMVEFQRLCEARQKKAWGDKPPPPEDDKIDKMLSQAREALSRKKTDGVVISSGGNRKGRK